MGARTADLDSSRLRLWPDLSFHYGLGYDELRRMPNGVREHYERSLGRLLAEQQLMAIEASSFSRMSRESQRSIQRGLSRRLGHKPVVPRTKEEWAGQAAASGVGVSFVGGDA